MSAGEREDMIPCDISRNGWLPERANVHERHAHAVRGEQLADEIGLGAFGIERCEKING